MIARELINELIPALKRTDKVQKVIDWMYEFNVNQLPLVEDQKCVGIVSDDDLEEDIYPHGTLEELPLKYTDVYAFEHQHFYEILKVATDVEIEMIPIVDSQKNYLGVVSIRDTALALSRTFASHMPGGIFILLVDGVQYSMAEISRLVESNNARVLSSFVEQDNHDPKKLKITVKVNTLDLTHILATFERFKYKVIGKFQDTETVADNAKDRLNMLFKYLEI